MNSAQAPAERIPPQALEAEVQCLGAALQDPARARQLRDTLRAADFYLTKHAHVFGAIASLLAREIPVDLATVGQCLIEAGRLTEVEAGYLALLVDQTPTVAGFPYHAEAIRKAAQQRRLIERLRHAEQRAWTNGAESGAILADLWEETRELEGGEARPRVPALDDPVTVLRTMREQGAPIPTGVAPLDDRLRGGMRPGRTLAAGGTAGAGKTALLIQMAVAAEHAGCAVAVLLADEGREPGIIRLGQQLGFAREALESGHEATLDALERECAGRRIRFPDPDEEDATLEGVTEALAQAYPAHPKLVVVDSIQTVRTRRPATEFPSVRERIMWNARTGRRLAVEHNLALIYSSEMNRAWYRAKREEDRASDLAAFAEARIEFAGDVLLAMRASEEDPDLVDVRIPKNRLGHRVGFLLRLDRKRALFTPVDGDPTQAVQDQAHTRKVEEALAEILRELERDQKAGGTGLISGQLLDLVGGKKTIFLEALRLGRKGPIAAQPGPGGRVLHHLTGVP